MHVVLVAVAAVLSIPAARQAMAGPSELSGSSGPRAVPDGASDLVVRAATMARERLTLSVMASKAGGGCVHMLLETGSGRTARASSDVRVSPGEHDLTVRIPAVKGDRTGGTLHWELSVQFVEYDETGKIGGFGQGESQFVHPASACVDGHGRLLIADTGNDRLEVLNSRGLYLFEVGGFTLVSSAMLPEGDAARFDEPWDVAWSANHEIYVSDTNNNRIVRLDADGRFLADFGVSDGLKLPRGLAIDPLGSVFVADSDNDRIAVFDRDGHFQREIGSFGFGERQLNKPRDVAVGPDFQVYVADRGNSRLQIFDRYDRVLDLVKAPLKDPVAVKVDPDGFAWVVDAGLGAALKLDAQGHEVARLLAPGGQPSDIAFGPDGAVFLVDSGASRILRFQARYSGRRAVGQLKLPIRR